MNLNLCIMQILLLSEYNQIINFYTINFYTNDKGSATAILDRFT